MITELSREHCWSLRQQDSGPVLVAYLNQTTYSRQLKALIELSDACRDDVRIYVTRDTGLKVISSAADITGTPTYILVCNGAEQDRLLGESDALRLHNFVSRHLGKAAARGSQNCAQGTGPRLACGCGYDAGK